MSHFDHVANEWDKPQKSIMMAQLAKKTLAHVSLGKDLAILDFGCGTGLFGLEFEGYAKSLTGVDTSAGMLEVFNQKTKDYPHINSIQIDLEKEILEEKFDLVVSSMTFHHLENPQAMIQKLKSMLTEQGKILVIDLEKEDGTFHPNNKEMGVKHHGFSKEEILNWAESNGLKVEINSINDIEKNDRRYSQFLACFSK